LVKKPIEVLIIDDDHLFVASLSDFLSHKGYSIRAVRNGRDGLKSIESHQPSIVLLDQKLPDMEGREVCRKILDASPTTKVIFVTAYATVKSAVDAMQAGAFNYLSKPFELDELLILMGLAARSVQMEGKIRVQNYEKEKARDEVNLIGSSEVMRRIKEQIKLASGTDANVVITGETGVGKNVVARSIHDLQGSRETFLVVNCATIPENLMEAEYFGHEKGIFTGADTRREGIFELASGGTLVLDEIAETPCHLQSKLLSVIEDKCVRRLGNGRNIPVDVRIIATTNQDLDEAIEERRFRQDLYYRLAVFHIHLPPLREHPEDIPEIAEYFVRKFCRRRVPIPDRHLVRMMEYPWPGNVRELRNVIERASLLLQGDAIKPANLLFHNEPDVSSTLRPQKVSDIQKIIPLQELKRQQIISALRACSGNKSLTARALGISLSTLKRRLTEMHLTSHQHAG
jgi:DNA-binding NtrC family response regulator